MARACAHWRAPVLQRGGKGRTKRVTRLNLIFEDETPEMMEKRRAVAAANRAADEARLRYRLKVGDVPPVLETTERQMGIIKQLIGHRVSKPDMSMDRLCDEVRQVRSVLPSSALARARRGVRGACRASVCHVAGSACVAVQPTEQRL